MNTRHNQPSTTTKRKRKVGVLTAGTALLAAGSLLAAKKLREAKAKENVRSVKDLKKYKDFKESVSQVASKIVTKEPIKYVLTEEEHIKLFSKDLTFHLDSETERLLSELDDKDKK